MGDDPGLSGLQLATLRALWELREGTTAEVQRVLARSRRLAITTVSTLLSRLEKRGLVTHRAMGRSFIYRAVVSETEVRRSTIRTVLRDVFRDDPSALLIQLVSQRDFDEADLKTMKKLLAGARVRFRRKTRRPR